MTLKALIKSHISQHSVDLIATRKSARDNLKFAIHQTLRPWWLPSVSQLAVIFKASASAARKSIAKDGAIRVHSMCDDAQRAHDKGDMRTFFSIKRALCPKPQSSPTFVMDVSVVCV